MSEDFRKAELARLEKEWEETYHAIREYRFLLRCKEERLQKIKRRIDEL